MRILYVTEGFTPHDQRFLSALAETNHHVYFLSFTKRKHAIRLPPSIVEIPLSDRKSSDLEPTQINLGALQKIIHEIKPDVVHAGPLHSVASRIAKLDYQPLVSMSWGYDLLLDADKSKEYGNLTRQVLDASTLLICDCKTVQEKAQSFGFPAQRIVNFPWGVDLNHFSPMPGKTLRDQLNWQNKFIIISTRALEPLYGVDILANAFVTIATQHEEVRLLLLGTGSQQSVLENIFAAAKITNKVFFAGSIDQEVLPTYYNTANLYVSASHVDGSSVSLLEAMACGLTGVVSDIPGNKEWIEDDKQGWLFKNNHADDLAEKLNKALQAHHQLKNMGHLARNTVEQRADWKKNFLRLLDAYELAVSLSTTK